MKYEIKSNNIDGIVFDVYWRKSYKNIKIKMLGIHQVKNAVTALYTIEILRIMGYGIDDSSIYNGLEEAMWPGRFEIISKSPYIILDGGHNLQGIESLTDSINNYFKDRKIITVCSILKDKEYEKMIDILSKISEKFITVKANTPRSLSAEELKSVIEKKGKEAIACENIEKAIEEGLRLAKEDDVILFCGSLYMIGNVRSILKYHYKI